MKTALFLGAGASAFALQPTTREIMGLLRVRVQQTKDEVGLSQKTWEYIMSVVRDDDYSDIEELYDGIDQIVNVTASRNCKPFIRNEDRHGRSIISKNKIRGLVSLRSSIRKILRSSFVIGSDDHKPIEQVYDMVWSVVKDHGTEKFQVFTTNYDLVIETYAGGAGFEVINGFEPYRYRSWVWTDAWTRSTDQPPLYLTKMHGSVYWYKDVNGKIVETGSVADVDADKDIMIAPTMGAKDYNKEPFSTLIGRFRDAMREVDVLLVIGFSYRDDEIVDIIRDGMKNGMGLISVSLDADIPMRRLINKKGKTINVNGERLKVVGPRIVLCDRDFGPNTISEVRAALNSAYTFIRPGVRRERALPEI